MKKEVKEASKFVVSEVASGFGQGLAFYAVLFGVLGVGSYIYVPKAVSFFKEKAENLKDLAKEKSVAIGETTKDKINELGNRTKEQAQQAKEKTKDKASELSDLAKNKFEKVKTELGDKAKSDIDSVKEKAKGLFKGNKSVKDPASPIDRESKLAACSVGPLGKPCESNSGRDDVCIVSGIVLFESMPSGGTTISYCVEGLRPGLHGFHIHEKSDFSNGCVSAGPHYNPHGAHHGGPADSERHVGDLGNIAADCTGRAVGVLRDPIVELGGDFSVLGRSIMIHADPDDLGKGGHPLSATTGNAGARVACGKIVSFP